MCQAFSASATPNLANCDKGRDRAVREQLPANCRQAASFLIPPHSNMACSLRSGLTNRSHSSNAQRRHTLRRPSALPASSSSAGPQFVDSLQQQLQQIQLQQTIQLPDSDQVGRMLQILAKSFRQHCRPAPAAQHMTKFTTCML